MGPFFYPTNILGRPFFVKVTSPGLYLLLLLLMKHAA
jgi:hypothetical protein